MFYSGTVLPRETFDPLIDAALNALLFGTSAVASTLDLAELERKKCCFHVSEQPVVFRIRTAFATKLDVLLSKITLTAPVKWPNHAEGGNNVVSTGIVTFLTQHLYGTL